MGIISRMKTRLGAVVIAALLTLFFAGAALAASYPFTGVITDDTNMRSTANSYASNVIRRIPEGDYVTVTGESGNFYRIEYDGKTGYVFTQYVKKSAQTNVSTGSGLTATGYPYSTIATSSVNLRKTASTSAKKLDTIPKAFFKSTTGTTDRVLTDMEKAIVLESVNNALANPLQMTQSQYTVAP